MRLYAKLWDKCLRKNIKLDERQKGFLPVDGCFENVQILKEVIKQQRKKRREYNLAFKDLAKAFDTVSYKSIEKGLRRKGVPAVVRETVMEMYKKATTRVTVGGKTTRRIKINSGVKQGCPLSPLLFNLIIDELLEKLKKKNIVIKIDNEIICCMAFADDLVILTQERIEHVLLTRCFFLKRTLLWGYSYLVDPSRSHILASKIKPCISKYKHLFDCTFYYMDTCGNSRANTSIKIPASPKDVLIGLKTSAR